MTKPLLHYNIRKLSVLAIFSCLFLASLPLAQLHAQCFNMTTLDADGTTCSIADHGYQYEELSDGTITSWYGWNWTNNAREDYGTSTTQYSNKYSVSNWGASRQTIITTRMSDPQQNAISTLPPDEQSCIRLGNPRAGGVGSRPSNRDAYRYTNWHLQAEAMQFEFKVESPIVDFQYAALVDRTNHLLVGDYPGAQPRIEIYFTDLNNNELDANSLSFSCWGDNSLGTAARQKDGWKTAYRNGSYQYYWKDWTTVSFDLSAYMGQTIQLHIENFDCVVEGDTHNFTYCNKHYSYLYFFLDCEEKEIEEECLGNQKVRLTAPEGFYYRWYTKSSDSTIGTSQSIEVNADGKETYFCELSQKEGMSGKFTLSTTPKCAPVVYITKTICEGDYYDFDGKHLTEPGEYSHIDHITPSIDSTTYLTLKVDKVKNMPLEEVTLCESDVYKWEGHGEEFAHIVNAGDYYDTTYYTSGCTKQRYHLKIKKIASLHSTETRITCTDELTTGFTWHGKWVQNISASGNTTWKGTASAGCDSIVTLILDVKDSIDVYDTFFVDNTFDFYWYGIRIFMDSQNGMKHVMDPNACPIVTKHLQLIKSPHITQYIDTCRDALPFIWHGRKIKGMEDDSIRIKETIGGTDTYYTLRLQLHDPYTGTIKRTICYGDTVYLGKETFTQTGVYTRELKSIFGCDSVVTLDLTVQGPPKEKIDRIDICEGDTYTWDPTKPEFTNLDKTDVYRDTLRYSTGCDSIYKVLKLYVHAAQTKFITIKDTICKGDSLYFYDNVFKTQGIHDVHLQTPFGCDSIIKLDLLVADTTHGEVSATFCGDEGSYSWKGHGSNFQNLTEEKDYIDTLINRFGCDSIVTLHLKKGTYNERTLTLSNCRPFEFKGKVFDSDTTFFDTIYSFISCDTIVRMTLKFLKPTTEDTTIVHLCDGDEPYKWNNHPKYQNITEGGLYKDTLDYPNGCDSVYSFLRVIKHAAPKDSIDMDAVCSSDLEYEWEGHSGHNIDLESIDWTKFDGNWEDHDTLRNAFGCDSIRFTLKLTIFHVEQLPLEKINGPAPSFQWTDPWGEKHTFTHPTKRQTFEHNVEGSEGNCQSSITVDITYNDTIYDDITLYANFTPFTWHGKTISSAADTPTSVMLKNKDGQDSVVTTLRIHIITAQPCVNMENLYATNTLATTSIYHVTSSTIQDNGMLLEISTWDTIGNTIVDYGADDPRTRHHLFTTQGNDLRQPALKVIPEGESTSIRLGNPFGSKTTGGECPEGEAIAFNITITEENALVLFKWAAVLEIANHDSSSQHLRFRPQQIVYFTDQEGNKLDTQTDFDNDTYRFYFERYGVNDLGKIGWQKFTAHDYDGQNRTAYWQDWTTTGFDMRNYVGQTVQLHIENFECAVEEQITTIKGGVQTVSTKYCGTEYGYIYFHVSCHELNLTAECYDEDPSQYAYKISAPEGFVYKWTKNNQAIPEADGYRDILIRADGSTKYTCQLIYNQGGGVYTEMDVTPSFVHTIIKDSICENEKQTFNWNGYSLDKFQKDTSSPYFYLHDTISCDSAVTLYLAVKDTFMIDTAESVCSNYPFPYKWHGKELNDAGILVDTLPTILGCDSIITLHLSIRDTSMTDTATSVCSNYPFPYKWHGKELNDAGTLADTLLNFVGCDSIVTLHLSIRDTSITDTMASVCSNYTFPYKWHGKELNDAGTLADTLLNFVGCDSIIRLTLSVVPAYSDIRVDTVISDRQLPYLWEDTTFTESGWATRTLKTIIGGCDSVVTMIVRIVVADTIVDGDTICQHELPYSWATPVQQHSLNVTGTYRDTLRTAKGNVDSVYYRFDLFITDELQGTLSADTACADDSHLNITYQVSQGIPSAYRIHFNDYERSLGFRDTSGTILPSDISNVLSIAIPHNDSIAELYLRPDNYSASVSIYGECEDSITAVLPFTILYPSWLLLQRWNDMIMLLNENYNGGYTFSNIRWFHNGENMDEQTRGDAHSYVYVYPNRLDMGADDYYWAELTRTDDGKTICTCKLQAVPMSDDLTFTQDKNAPSIRLSHSTIDANHRDITITSNFSGTYRLYSANGMYLQEGFFGTAYNSPTITIEAGLPTGAYILLFQGDEGTTKSEKLLIK